MVDANKDEEAIFNAAIEFESSNERDAYLAKACGNDKKLRAAVEALLRAHFEADNSFLTAPPGGIGGTLDAPPLTEGPGTRIGRYKLLQLIGEGGFGVVYMAEQEEPIRRRVALKIIKLGMDTKQVIARFEAERQALAMMEHPNIAKVLDAGATDTGRPYFVMELVKGIPITEYCDKNNLDTRQRLELFIDVCKAVQHAHQKGIIHRDIKPSNVMITLRDDGTGVPKIIDFGIAKATQQKLTEKTYFTEFKQFIGTPEYMSPEQARMGELDVDTRSDIYSLGVLLYELLTGTTPFEAKQLRSAAYDEMLKTIRETEPQKPSTLLNTLGDALGDVAKHRKVEPGQLSKIISGDLDWIVLKTLEKDRTRRYETANELVADVQRHLGDEPVVAGPPSTVYRLRKFVRRNRALVTSIAVVAAALVIGLALATVGFVQASRQRDFAEAQRQRASVNFQMARDAVEEMTDVAEKRLADVPGTEPVRRELLQKAQIFYAGFLEENSDDPAVREEIGRACLRLGDICQRLDQGEQAEQSYRGAIDILEELDDELPGISYHRYLLGKAYGELVCLLVDSGRPIDTEQVHGQALGFLDRLGENEVATRAYWRNLVAYGKNPTEAKVFRLSEEVSCVRAQTPSNLLPLAGSLVESFPVVLNVSSFAHEDPEVTHAATWWQVRTADESYSHPTLDRICDENLESIVIPQERLLPRTTYYWRASFIDSDGHASTISSEQPFTTADFGVEVVRFDLSPYFNRDVVANPGDQENDTVDGQGGYFVKEGFDGLVSNNPEVQGLPHDHVVGVHLLADYNYVNVLQTSAFDKGNLRVDIPPGNYSCIRFLVAGGNGASQMPITFEYADGSTQRDILSCSDWYYDTPTGPMGALYSGVTPVVDGMDRLWYDGFQNSNKAAVFEVSLAVEATLELVGFVLEMGGATYHDDVDYWSTRLTRFNLMAATGVRFLPGRLEEAEEAYRRAEEIEEEAE